MKAVLIGIDGLDFFLIEKYIDSLPNFKKIKKEGVLQTIQSTFPPDSICAWGSIFTGKNPAQHGLLESIDYLSKKECKYAKGHSFEKETFWDEISNLEKRVCVINPFLAYPAWKVNGIMVSGSVFEGGETTAFPGEILQKFNFPSLGGWVDFPDEKDLGEFIKKTRTNTEELAKVSLEIYKKFPSDLFFLTFLTSDRIQHFLWRFTDEEDPTFPGENPFKNSIKEFYILFDQIIGEFMKIMDEESVLIVLSDHGHKRRCVKCLNLNEFLRKRGYLFLKSENVVKGGTKKLVEKMKTFALRFFHKYGLQDLMYKIAKFIPNRKALRKASYLIDKNKSLAYSSELCSTNPFGGIEINKNENYEELRTQIIKELEGLNEALKEEVVEWVKRREKMYQGEYLNRYPDVVFKLNEDYGVNWDLFAPLITENYTHRKVSGGHREQGVLGIWCKEGKFKGKVPVSIIEIKDFILKIINSENPPC